MQAPGRRSHNPSTERTSDIQPKQTNTRNQNFLLFCDEATLLSLQALQLYAKYSRSAVDVNLLAVSVLRKV
jgi:hypothetical protein